VALTVLFDVTLISAVDNVSRPTWAFKVGLGLIVPTIVVTYLPYLQAEPYTPGASMVDGSA